MKDDGVVVRCLERGDGGSVVLQEHTVVTERLDRAE
jgi:hypothetical protein